MSLSNNSRRRHALALVHRLVSAGTFTKDDVKRWKAEFGPAAVDEIVAGAGKPKGQSKSEPKSPPKSNPNTAPTEE